MMALRSAALVISAASGLVSAQYEGWSENQVNASICAWSQPRGAVIRDTVYMDGGLMYWSQGLSNGEYGPIDSLDNPLGLVYSLNFSLPFNTSSNVTALFETRSKARGGSGNANNEAPNYLDGGMLVNDAQLSLYGGLVRSTSAFDPPREDDVLTYQAYQYGPERGTWQPGFVTHRLPEDMTRYIAYGGAVSAPSENKAWYFSGLRSPEWGPIFQGLGNISEAAVNVSDTLVTLDMADQVSPVWSNETLPPTISGRANPEVVWVPVGEQGILVVLGGVTYPDWAGRGRRSENEAQSTEESDEFMQTIDIYDIAEDTWYRQPTEDGPTARTRGCAVVAPAQDYSSFNIYYYGGYAGVDPTVDMNDEVWVLSIPSFTWTRISESRQDYGRNGHKCFMPYPDQLMIIGGMASLAGGTPACLMGGVIQIFNLTSGEWMDEYNPENYYDYGVPSAVQSKIGGEATGGATLTTPSPSGWADDDLAEVFGIAYETSKIQTWYPYAAAQETDRPVVDNDGDNDNDDSGGGGGGGLPNWVAPVLGVVLGLVFLSALLVAFCLWRRRKYFRRNGGLSEASTDENGMRIMSWIKGQPTEPKAPTVTTSEDSPSNLDMVEVSTPGVPTPAAAATTSTGAPAPRFEVDDTGIAELPDSSRPPELSDTGLSPIEIINRHSHFASTPPNATTGHNTSYYGSVSGNEASSMSHSSAVAGLGANSHGSSPHNPGTPQLDNAVPANSRITSGVSGISASAASHLRNLSDATVSSASEADREPPSNRASRQTVGPSGLGASPLVEAPSGQEHQQQEQPAAPVAPASVALPAGSPGPSPMSPGAISPPTAGETTDSDDYISARALAVSPTGPASPLRRSVFQENPDDLGPTR